MQYLLLWGGIASQMTLWVPNDPTVQVMLQYGCYAPCNLSAPMGIAGSRCGAGAVSLSASGCSGGTLNWYTAPSGGTWLGSGSTITTPSISSTTTYYVDCTIGSCTSPRTAVTATITSAPTAPIGTGGSRCGTGTVSLSASGCTTSGGAATLTIPISISSSPVDGTFTSPAIFGAATMAALPAGATVTGASISIPNININLSTSYQSEVRVDINGGISTIGVPGIGALSNNISPFTYTYSIPTGAINTAGGAINFGYWESADDGGGVADAIFPIGANVGTITIDYTTPASSGTLNWYTASSGGTWLGSGSTFTTPSISSTTTYYVDCSVGSCASPRTAVTATVNTTPAAAIAGTTATCNGASTTLTASGGGTYVWNTGETTAAVSKTAGTYTVTVTVSGCTSTASRTVTNTNVTAAIAGALTTCNGASTTLTASGGGTYAWNTGETTAAVSKTAGTYTVTVTVSGCTSTAAVTVSNTNVTAAIAGTTATCNGASTTLTASGGGTYAWNTGETTAAVSKTAGTYTVTVTNTGCTSTASVTVTNTNVTASISGTTATCNGASTTLTASGGGTYAWTGGQTTAAVSVTAGTYTVTVTVGTCTSTSAVTVTNVAGSVGNYVWNDTNSDGINNEPTTAGINGVTVELWNNGTNTLSGTTTTANDGSGNAGYYNFVICTSGNYYVKFPTTNGATVLTTATTTAATDNNSDANMTTGNSPVFAIDINGTSVAKDNPTIDAGYKISCAPPCIPMTVTKTK